MEGRVPAVVLVARSILLVTFVVTGNRGFLGCVASLVLVLRGSSPVVSSPIILVRRYRPRRALLKATISFLRIRRRGTFEIGSLATVAVTRVLVRGWRTGRWARSLILDSISWWRRLQFRHRVTNVPAIRDIPAPKKTPPLVFVSIVVDIDAI